MDKENVTMNEEGLSLKQEYVILKGETFRAESVMTGLDSISFILADIQLQNVVEIFKDATELSVSGEDLQPYGFYGNLTFESATVDAAGTVTVKLRIAKADEISLEELKVTQAEQDEAIAGLMFGGGIE